MVKILKMGMEHVSWDVSMVVLKSFDEVMHHFCKLLDFSWDTSSNPRDAHISRFFKELDEVIADILKLVREHKATVFIVTDHGGEVNLATIYINNMLRELGYLMLIPERQLLRENARRFLGSLGNPYKLVGVDDKGTAAVDWGVYGVPETFLVDGAGVIRYKWIGPISEQALTEELLPRIRSTQAKKSP